MTPIKFRAWHKAEKIMLPHVGRLGFGIGDELASVDAGQTDNWLWDGYHTFRGPEELAMIVLMQSTGLHDKNGKEIFEGDILHEKHPEGDDRGQVMWIEGGFDLVSDDGVTSLAPQIIWGGYEVIGNIHSDPHLLK